MPIMRVPQNVATAGLLKAGGKFQEDTYGQSMRVCTVSLKDTTKYRDTVTGIEFSKQDFDPLKKKK